MSCILCAIICRHMPGLLKTTKSCNRKIANDTYKTVKIYMYTKRLAYLLVCVQYVDTCLANTA